MKLAQFVLIVVLLGSSLSASASKFLGAKTLDKDYIMLQFRDGEVRYRDNGTGPSAFLGHTFVEGDDTLKVFAPRLITDKASDPNLWKITSSDDKDFGTVSPVAIFRKAKPMNTDHTLTSELDHTLFLKLPKSMRQGCSYQVSIPNDVVSDTEMADVNFDIFSSPSEAVHVNIIGYKPSQHTNAADLYLWLGDGGQRDYSDFEGNRVWLYNVDTQEKKEVGKVSFWKKQNEYSNEANGKNNTGSDVWNIDFPQTSPGRYRLVVEDVGCSMDFCMNPDVYFEPYKTSLRGYYYMRLGEKPRPDISPVPRQPTFIPGEDPSDFKIYITDFHPWSDDWKKLRMDVWDEPHFKLPEESLFHQHRVEGNRVNDNVRGGHSDAFDWDRHLAHVSNIYDLLLPIIITQGAINDDNLSIPESGNGLPDLIDEARNEVDFFLSIRDGEGYSQGVTNPTRDWKVMYQAGCTTMAAWANAANCAMLAESLRLTGHPELAQFYTQEAIKAYEYALRQENSQLEDVQHIGDGVMRGLDFKNMAAAYLYNLTGDTRWEDVMASTSLSASADSHIWSHNQGIQTWATAAYLHSPHKRNYSDIYNNMVKAVNRQADDLHLSKSQTRPSRRTTNDPRWQTSENLQLLMIAHSIVDDPQRKAALERAMILDADWCLGRNPSNTVEMTGLGQRHITDCYSTGRNDGVPGTHPGQTPFNGTETWSPGHNGGDARVLLAYCYPKWEDGWPSQESFFNQRYFWVNGEFTPRETMRGKMALLAYLNSLR